jgi:hypothetical protein
MPRPPRTPKPLEHEVFEEAADGVVGERGDDGGAEVEAAAEATGDVVFAATLPDAELAGVGDALVAGVETQHDFAEGDEVEGGGFGGVDGEAGGVGGGGHFVVIYLRLVMGAGSMSS